MGSSSHNQTRIRRRGFTLVEVLVTIGIIGTVAALLLPALSRGKAKAHRIKCLNNLSTIGKALTIYGHSFDGRLPWQILDIQQREQLGSSWSDFTMSPAASFSLPPMVREIGNAKVLLSPCDPGRLPYNEEAQQMWDTWRAGELPAFVKGGDMLMVEDDGSDQWRELQQQAQQSPVQVPADGSV